VAGGGIVITVVSSGGKYFLGKKSLPVFFLVSLTLKNPHTRYTFDVRVCVTVHHIWKWQEVSTWWINYDLLS